jgi:hypothetical protein
MQRSDRETTQFSPPLWFPVAGVAGSTCVPRYVRVLAESADGVQ